MLHFEWLLAAAVLARVDRGQWSLGATVTYGPDDVLEYAPVTRQHVERGSMTVDALAAACVSVSDNTAANLLLERLGGPAALTTYARSKGDALTRLDRNEPTLNLNEPADERDTTTPRAMVRLMQKILCGNSLSEVSRRRLLGWLRASTTGKRRLAAGFPSDWLLGDKTGSGMRNAINDVAIAVPPGRAPLLVAVYTDGSASPMAELEEAHAARIVTREL